MAKYQVQSPDGVTHEFEGPEGASQEDVIKVAQQMFPDHPASKPAEAVKPPAKRDDSIGAGMLAGIGKAAQTIRGTPEAATQMATGALAAPVAGIAGAAQTGVDLALGKKLDPALSAGADRVQKVEHAMTYEPRSAGGKEAGRVASLPMEVANHLLGKAGEAAGGLVGPRTAAAGSVVGENLLPVALAAEGGRRTMSSMDAAPAVPGKDFSPLRDLTPDQAKRMTDQKSQGIDPTLGSVTRESPQVRMEQQTAQMPGGQRLAQRAKETDQALTGSVERLKLGKDVAGHTPDLTESSTGRSVRTALEKKAEAGKQKIDDLYEKARASGETKEMVDLDPLKRYLDKHKAEAISVPKLNSVRAMVNELVDLHKEDHPGHASIDEIESLRQRIGELGQGDGSVKVYMGDLRKGIDLMTEGKGGQLYKDARAARKQWGDEFEERLGNARVLDKATRTDYKTATEDVWNKTVKGGSIDDLKNVVDSLRNHTDAKGKPNPQSARALKDLQAHTIDQLAEAANQTQTFSPGGFRKGLNSIGREKLELLLGKDATASLYKTAQNARDVKEAPTRAPGSDTFLNESTVSKVKDMAAEHVQHLVKAFIPKIAGKALDALTAGSKERAAKRAQDIAIDDALTPRRASLGDIAKQAKQVKSDRSTYVSSEARRRAAPAAAATITMKDSNERPNH